LPFLFAFIISLFVCNSIVKTAAEGKIYSDLNAIPRRETGLLLGVSKKDAPAFFNGRVTSAAELYKAGKIKKLLLSGDSAANGYDEPGDMKAALIGSGVPDSVITMDRSGHRTLQSILRCRNTYHKDKITVISQEFHDVRAVYLASQIGLDAIGYVAEGPKWTVREYVSRVVAVFESKQ
jgi:SanA protein